MLAIREERLEHPPASVFLRRDVEPVLRGDDLVVYRGSWPGRAMIQSTIVLQTSAAVAVHVRCYPRHGFPELWRYYLERDGLWFPRQWQQLPVPVRHCVLEAYAQGAPAFASHPGNIPGRPELDRALKRGPTYLLVAVEAHGYVSLVNRAKIYTLDQLLTAPRASYDSYPCREILLIKWQQGGISTWLTEPFCAAVVECEVGGTLRLSQGQVESEQLCLRRVLEEFEAAPPAKTRV